MNTHALIHSLRKIPVQSAAIPMGLLAALTIAHFSKFEYAHHMEGAIIAGMGLWRILSEKDPYQRFRVGFIVIGVSLAWFVLPGLGVLGVLSPSHSLFFPSIHKLGSIAFFVFMVPVILFGRGADCGWFCPCVATRETGGYAFRGATPKGKIWWHLRHLKWPATIVALMIIPVSLIGGDSYGDWIWPVQGHFYAYVFYGYFGSFLLLPVLGNRNFCRFACPYGAIWGLVGKYGFFHIKSEQEGCTDCKKCERACDMGIPISDLAKQRSTIRTVECMGCGRCVQSCPDSVLSCHDIRGERRIPKNVG